MNNATTAMPPSWQRMRDRWRSANPVVRDSIGAVALMALALLPLGIKGVQLGELHREVGPWAAVVLMAGQTLPLAVRRTQPALALLVIGVAFGVTQTIGADTGLAGLGLLIALYSCAAHLRRGRVVTIVGCGVGYLVLVAVLIAQGSPEEVIDWITFAAVLAVPWVAGELARRWRVEQAARFERAAAAADRQARALLARELHDIVTHHVTAMVVQAESARYLDDTPQGLSDRDAIAASVSSTGRLALTELRSLLGTLEPDTGSSSRSERADEDATVRMVRRLQQTGYPISMQISGSVDDIPDEIIAVMHGVARETVTNAMKHARGQEVRLTISVTERAFELTVVNSLVPDASAAANPLPYGGRGSSGMQERVSEQGGLFTANAKDGQYTVIARWRR